MGMVGDVVLVHALCRGDDVVLERARTGTSGEECVMDIDSICIMHAGTSNRTTVVVTRGEDYLALYQPKDCVLDILVNVLNKYPYKSVHVTAGVRGVSVSYYYWWGRWLKERQQKDG